ncbi:hypothetical protein [Pseudovibrio sp. SCP19]|uniref:hypothetical protein n=1 Tax=Pseudovibrio sp. SCP19 TaxID=3141374 RepID=UPI0033375049
MSYDVILLSEKGEEMRKLVYDFFSARPNYEVSTNDIMYENPETGVHFQWIFTPYHEDDLNEETTSIHAKDIGHLRLNFARPTAFAKEAALELLALSQSLPVQFYDLQQDSIYDKFINAEQLTAPYAKHAQSALSAMIESSPEMPKPQVRPKQLLDSIWEWNFNRDALTASLSEDLFVPKIDFFRFDGELKTGIVWGDGIPMLCPRADIVIVYRKDTAPRTSWFKQKQAVIDVITFDEFKKDYKKWLFEDSQSLGSLTCSSSDAKHLRKAVATSKIRREVHPIGEEGMHSLEALPFMTVLDSEICIPTSTQNTAMLKKPT